MDTTIGYSSQTGHILSARSIRPMLAAEGQKMGELEARFETDMVETVYRTTGRETGYWAAYFLRAVKRHGGVVAAKRLLATRGLSRGLVKLRQKNRLDLSMESLVLRPEYFSLFTDEERAIATRRLEDARAMDVVA